MVVRDDVSDLQSKMATYDSQPRVFMPPSLLEKIENINRHPG